MAKYVQQTKIVFPAIAETVSAALQVSAAALFQIAQMSAEHQYPVNPIISVFLLI
jgi:hypothetical protein